MTFGHYEYSIPNRSKINKSICMIQSRLVKKKPDDKHEKI